MDILSLLFPKYCVLCKRFGSYLCDDCFATISFDVEYICFMCNKHAIDGITHPGCRMKYSIDGGFGVVKYAGSMKRLIAAFKFRPYVADLQHVLTDLFYEGLLQNEQFQRIMQTDSIFVPIPLYKQKERERGYNHAELLARNLGKRFNVKTVNILKRIRKTESQMNLDREERKKNMNGAFAIDEKVFKHYSLSETRTPSTSSKENSSHSVQRIKPWEQVILLDDIVTSGTTMIEAANVLKRHGVEKVWGIALAHGK